MSSFLTIVRRSAQSNIFPAKLQNTWEDGKVKKFRREGLHTFNTPSMENTFQMQEVGIYCILCCWFACPADLVHKKT